MSGLPPGEFSVWLFMPDDWHFPVAEGVDAATAVRMAKLATLAPGRANRIIVVDSTDDSTAFEWRRGEGVTFPPQEGA